MPKAFSASLDRNVVLLINFLYYKKWRQNRSWAHQSLPKKWLVSYVELTV